MITSMTQAYKPRLKEQSNVKVIEIIINYKHYKPQKG